MHAAPKLQMKCSLTNSQSPRGNQDECRSSQLKNQLKILIFTSGVTQKQKEREPKLNDEAALCLLDV